MGERSKYLGELGEDFAAQTISILGWQKLGDWGADFPCEDADHRTVSGTAEKREHGIDGVYGYEDPYTKVFTVVIVEGKALSWVVTKKGVETPKNKSSIGTDLDGFVKTLSEKISCAKRSAKFKEFFGLTGKRIEILGAIVYYVHSGYLRSTYEGVLEKIVLPGNGGSSPIFILDNMILQHILSMGAHLRLLKAETGKEAVIEYMHPDGEKLSTKTPWTHHARIQQLFSSFLTARVTGQSGASPLQIFYFGTYSQTAIRRFCAATARFNIITHDQVDFIPISSRDPVESKHSFEATLNQGAIRFEDRDVEFKIKNAQVVQPSFPVKDG
ncbi:MAG TPA: hypothetical protein PKC28_03000 [Bdellovibrionales bacterium]|nr:hypothetical protein [Bdellovibrionales bacterium]